jgi:23S rRNA (cytidine1920-2'-O)/16S rRNA (cytidine1409-2'-O)-methyltransferase
VDIVVADLSFISLTVVVPALVGLLKDGGHLIALIKPQFEVGREEVSRGRGVITDPELHSRACETVVSACEDLGLTVEGVVPSPILGQEGNREFLLHGVLRARLLK